MRNAPVICYSTLAAAALPLALLLASSPTRADELAAPRSDAPAVQVDAPVVQVDAHALVVEYDDCARACDGERRVLMTDRHTCRYTCDAVLEMQLDGAPTAVSDAVASTLAWRDGCVADCRLEPRLSRTDRETCLLTCSESAAALCALPPAPAAAL